MVADASNAPAARDRDGRSPLGRGTVAVIPARGGSTSIPKKNLALLGGRPLLAWSIDVAQRVPRIDRVIVSTDDPEIARTALGLGAEVSWRPAALAGPDALVIDALRDLLARLDADGEMPRTLVLLEPTCPFRASDDVARCLALLDDEAIDSVATFAPAALNPWRAWRIDGQRPTPFVADADPWLPRQRLPPAYQLNGAVYAFRAERLGDHPAIVFGRTAAVVMPPERSIDIDGPIDLLLAEAHLARGGA
jgi:CMP-N,N'-diacetyllegionaminic acid synthase